MTKEYEPLTIHEAAAAMRAGALTPIDLLDQCLARIDRYESVVRAWVVIDLDGAREQAQRLTDELKRGQVRGPLHGIPIGVKDIIDVFDLPTGCGSKLWANSIARQDATCVKRLRAAGAVILGKTVTTPYAYLDPPVTRNPWDPSRTPGGSSSGSAAAVACGMCLAALGTQTGGSLTRPASFCGVYSLKPTYRRVSRAGVLPLAPTLDHVGFMARSATDLAIMFQSVAGPDDADSHTRAEPVPDVLRALKTICEPGQHYWGPPNFLRLRGLFDDRADPETMRALDGVMVDLQSLVPAPQSSFRDAAISAAFADIHRHHRTIMAVEAADFHRDRLNRHSDDYPVRIRQLIEDGIRHSALEYHAAIQAREMAQLLVDDTGWAAPAHVLVTLAAPGPAPERSTTGDAVFNIPWTFTGHPTVSIPIGRSEDGLPWAMQIAGKEWDEENLLLTAAWVEQRLNPDMRFPPAQETFTTRES